MKIKRNVQSAVDRNYSTQILIENQDDLRKLVGILGMALPFILFGYLFFKLDLTTPLNSISHYYFTQANVFFQIIVSLMAFFLIIYKGLSSLDFYLSTLAGVFAFVLLICPTSNVASNCCDEINWYAVTYLSKQKPYTVMIHFIASGIFLSSLAFMSIFIFTKSTSNPTSEKRFRNVIYRSCGIIMILALCLILLSQIIPNTNYQFHTFYNNHQITFWLEAIAIEAFGFSWLVKGKTLFKDKQLM